MQTNDFLNFTAMNPNEPQTLSQLLGSLEQTIRREHYQMVWVKTEISKINFYKYSGHAYPDLVERINGKVIAQMRGIIWAQDFARINKKFMDMVREPLKDAIEVVCYGRLTFSAQYGLSFIINDIDPQLTLGQFEKERLNCINKLKKENLFSLNATKKLPVLPQRLAIISVSTSKGYSDFINVINSVKDKYGIFYHVFPSLLQGDNAAVQMREVLQIIEQVNDYFDCVLIIRGGGGDIGLNCYNDYELCSAIARFPLPVLTGIGHSTNETVVEMVSNQNFITPTALGEFIIGRFQGADNNIETLKQKINQISYLIIKEQYKNISFAEDFIRINSKNIIEKAKINIDGLQKYLDAVNPKNILKKGYSITTFNGKLIKSKNEVKKGDKIKTQILDGEFISTVD